MIDRLPLVHIRNLLGPPRPGDFVGTIPAAFAQGIERPLLPPDAVESGHPADGGDEPLQIVRAFRSACKSEQLKFRCQLTHGPCVGVGGRTIRRWLFPGSAADQYIQDLASPYRVVPGALYPRIKARLGERLSDIGTIEASGRRIHPIGTPRILRMPSQIEQSCCQDYSQQAANPDQPGCQAGDPYVDKHSATSTRAV